MNGEVADPNCKYGGSILVAIPAVAAHRPIVEISLSRLKARFTRASFLIVSPSPEVFDNLTDMQTRIAPDDEFSVVTKIGLARLLSPSKRQNAGWYYQQLLKFSIVAQSPFDRVLILDADTIVLREIELAPHEFFTSKERHKPYFVHFKALFKTDPPFKSSAITNLMWFSPVALRQMLSEIEQVHKQLWWMAIINIANPIAHDGAFSEYETYANWYALRHGPHSEVPIDIFRRGELLLRNENDYSRVLSTVLKKGFDSVAFEFNHNRSIARRATAKLILLLSFKKWW